MITDNLIGQFKLPFKPKITGTAKCKNCGTVNTKELYWSDFWGCYSFACDKCECRITKLECRDIKIEG